MEKSQKPKKVISYNAFDFQWFAFLNNIAVTESHYLLAHGVIKVWFLCFLQKQAFKITFGSF